MPTICHFTQSVEADSYYYFAPDQSNHRLRLVFVDDALKAREILPSFEDDMKGLCAFDHDTKEPLKCVIVVLLEDDMVFMPVVIHELAHAALEWVNSCVMPMAEKHISQPDLDNYYHESVAHTVEALVSQIF